MRFWLIIAPTILIIQSQIVLTTERFYVCDKNCPIEKCDEEDETEESKVCVHIIESDPDGELVELPNMCAFNCANKCYENQLIAIPGRCVNTKKPSGRGINQPQSIARAVKPGSRSPGVDEDDEDDS